MTFGEYIGQLNRVANKILLILCIPFILGIVRKCWNFSNKLIANMLDISYLS